MADVGPGSLREAIHAANASAGVADTIVFQVSGTIRLASRLPDIVDDLTIEGSGQQVTVSGGKAVQLLFVAAGRRVHINQLTLADGYCAPPCSGGAIANVGFLEVNASRFIGNAALLGGAIHNFGGLKVTQSTFQGNSAKFGGAIHNFDQLEISDSTFTANAAAQDGGAIHNFDRLTVVGSRFGDNSARHKGGGINNLGTLHMTGSSLADNTADGIRNGITSDGERSTETRSNGYLMSAAVPQHRYAQAHLKESTTK